MLLVLLSVIYSIYTLFLDENHLKMNTYYYCDYDCNKLQKFINNFYFIFII